MSENMIFDTHAHYDDEDFDADRAELLTGLSVRAIVNSGASMRGCEASVSLAQQYERVYASVGIHPDEAGEIISPEAMARLKELACSSKVIAIGEIGLDYHWDKWPHEVQKDAFLKQWNLAVELGLPIIIHSRDAAEDTMDIVRSMYEREKTAGRRLRADMHCYSYSAEQAREYCKMGFYFGIGGVLTFKNGRKLREVVEVIPLERLLLETDAPYLAPEPFRGKRNNSGYISYVAEKIAEIKGITTEEVYEATLKNAYSFFGLEE